MKNRIFIYFLLFSAFFPTVSAQKKVKFGDVTPEEVQMTVFEKDPAASAVVLYESKETRYDILAGDMVIINNYFIRIKILTNDGLDYANQSVSNYVGTSRALSDDLNGLSGNTYNWENGKVVKIKLSKEHIFEEKISESRVQTKFTFQSVKPGSVIEYKYELRSPYYTYLDDVYFQRSIPVVYSRYDLLIPEYFSFSKETKGMSYIKTTPKMENQRFTVSGGTIDCSSDRFIFEAEDLPGLKDEGYLWSIRDYLTRVPFELRGITIPGAVYKNFSATWDKVDEQLLDSDDFGKQLNHKLFKEDLAAIVKPDMKELDKVTAIHNMVRSRVKWNDKDAFWIRNPKDALKKGLGTSAEINGLLICALREAGFEAYPVALSKRTSGRIPMTHPTINSLNYFVVGCQVEGKPVYMDASAKYGTINVISPNYMTDFSRSIRGNLLSEWVDLTRINKSRKVVNLEMGFNEEGILSGSVLEMINGEVRYGFLNRFNSYENQDKYIEARQTEDNILISDFTLEGTDGSTNQSSIRFNFTRNETTLEEDLVYFNPLLVPLYKENPFKAETRELPVEFSYPSMIQIDVIIKIPQNYIVEELPELKKINLNDKDASLIYIAKYDDASHSVNVSIRSSLDRIVYPMDQYTHLREYFANLTTANNAQIVLKKKAQ